MVRVETREPEDRPIKRKLDPLGSIRAAVRKTKHHCTFPILGDCIETLFVYNKARDMSREIQNMRKEGNNEQKRISGGAADR
jgi:hypothetical protein